MVDMSNVIHPWKRLLQVFNLPCDITFIEHLIYVYKLVFLSFGKHSDYSDVNLPIKRVSIVTQTICIYVLVDPATRCCSS